MAKATSKTNYKGSKKKKSMKKNGNENGQQEAEQNNGSTAVKTEQAGRTENGRDKFESTHAKYERVKRGNLHITKRLSTDDLTILR